MIGSVLFSWVMISWEILVSAMKGLVNLFFVSGVLRGLISSEIVNRLRM